MKKNRQILPILLLAVFLISLISIGYLGYKEVKKELSIQDMEKELQDEYIERIPEKNPDAGEQTSPDGYVFDWNGLLGTNSDVVGWIRFDNPARINYPIVQGKSNQTYLYRDWAGRYQSAGAIFLHKNNDKQFRDQNSVIYGHRMMGGSMFGGLSEYGSKSFMDANPYFYIYTPDGKKRTYEIFAYAKVLEGSDVYKKKFDTAKERLTYYKTIRSQAIITRDIELDEFDTTVTLSTCANRGYYNRMVLEGKLIRIEVNQQP